MSLAGAYERGARHIRDLVRSQAPISDAERVQFLARLDAAPFEVTDWEAGFVETAMRQKSFSVKQRSVIDRLMCKYSGRLA